MNSIDQVKRYIEETKISNARRYEMNTDEVLAIGEELYTTHPIGSVLDAIHLAFKYGRAKGYRARKAEERHG